MKRHHRARFRLLTVVQIALLITSILLLAWSVMKTEFIAIPLVVGFAVGLQTMALLRHVEAHVDSLEDFFSAVNYEDFTRRFIGDDVDTELKEAFNRVLSKFQDARAERELQASYLETIVRHVPIPFIAARSDGAVTLVNIPARQLTGLAALTRIDQLAELDLALPGLMRSIEPGRQQLLQTKLRGVPAELRVSVSEIRLAAGVERLYSIENLSGELTAREASAWRNLIRVLTHEIMNTLTPVTSLAQTAAGLLDNADAKADVRLSIETIARRSEGLMTFVLRYRELLKVPQPVPTIVSVLDTLQAVRTLMSDELARVQVVIDVSPETLEVSADGNLLDQVLLNLVRNSLDALKDSGQPRLELSGRLSFGRVLICVRDNGCGIDEETIAQIFVPFFTTKREGSGIGLSLSRQIMTAHGGEIAVESDTNGTIARLVF
ncbi:MAG: ATP-binding protein [Proteobacteria bacterium]|nr:ATP-binding protein [Pseudomonadota bacterium]MDA0992978.1 ATP-binding protein [Pseudomonadota bacterium]